MKTERVLPPQKVDRQKTTLNLEWKLSWQKCQWKLEAVKIGSPAISPIAYTPQIYYRVPILYHKRVNFNKKLQPYKMKLFFDR